MRILLEVTPDGARPCQLLKKLEFSAPSCLCTTCRQGALLQLQERVCRSVIHALWLPGTVIFRRLKSFWHKTGARLTSHRLILMADLRSIGQLVVAMPTCFVCFYPQHWHLEGAPVVRMAVLHFIGLHGMGGKKP
jgi:hypothetical protein